MIGVIKCINIENWVSCYMVSINKVVCFFGCIGIVFWIMDKVFNVGGSYGVVEVEMF